MSGKVGQLAARARPNLASSATTPARPPQPQQIPLFDVTVGWAVWFGNRRVGLRDSWFRLRTASDYRDCPQP